ncbi:MAG TPA: Hsp33 family molecular chaperone HslO [Candidimonas sp.]|nr:Hsp33 family molecular chaperone HslO [Candidimonas sp.]
MTDQFRKYLLPDHSSRVQAVKLSSAWQTGLAHQHYPECLQRLLGELVSAAVLMATNIKFDGSLVLQLQGSGPIALMVAECTADLAIRATVTVREGHDIPQDGTLQSLLNADGKGRFVVVLDPNRDTTDIEPYQGIVPLEGTSLSQVLEHYMRHSEQLDTRIWLAADAQRCAGLLLQRLPDHGGAMPADDASSPDETWKRICALAATVTQDELLSLETESLIHRLFWEEDLIAFTSQHVEWHCPCTRERVANMLRSLGQQEVEDILSEREVIEIACNFCGKLYVFDPVDSAGLFVDNLDTANLPHKSVH